MTGTADKDPYLHAVMQRLSPSIRDSLTPAQKAAIEEALMESHPKKSHLLDLRLNIPLFFGRYYLVFLMGRDRRIATRRSEMRRQKSLYFSSIALFCLMFLSPFVIIILLIVYAVKSALGIDLFPDWHFKDMLRLW